MRQHWAYLPPLTTSLKHSAPHGLNQTSAFKGTASSTHSGGPWVGRTAVLHNGGLRTHKSWHILRGSTAAVATLNLKLHKTLAPTFHVCTSPIHLRCSESSRCATASSTWTHNGVCVARTLSVCRPPHLGHVNPLSFGWPYDTWASLRNTASRANQRPSAYWAAWKIYCRRRTIV